MPVSTPVHLLLGLPFLLASFYFFYKDRVKPALIWLFVCAFVVRLVMICLDPYLHEWDEQYHAVVAKSMMTHPFVPALRPAAVLPYTMTDWCCSYIWLHKQPLFMWQMALSMKAFGVNTVALRLPNVLFGTAVLWPVFRIAKIWVKQWEPAYFAALFYALSFQALELSSGRLLLEHNDLMFGFYVTASIWAFCEYTQKPALKWVFLTGLFAGGAILIKWLTGLLVFGGWGLYLLTGQEDRKQWINYLHGVIALFICTAVFLPWQIYIQHTFPAESAASYAYFRQHIFDDLGHPGNNWFHLKNMETTIGIALIPFFITGLWALWKKEVDKRMSVAMVSMYAVVYLFFSIIVATKMPGFTFPVSAIGFIITAIGFYQFFKWIEEKSGRKTAVVTSLLWGLLCMQAEKITMYRSASNIDRNTFIYNTNIYRKIPETVAPDVIIFNCKPIQDPAVRFWTDNNAYQLFPESEVIDSLLGQGYKIAAFTNHNDQRIPAFWAQDKRIQKIEMVLK